MNRLPQTRHCFACGKDNPQGLNLSFRTDGSQVVTDWTPQSRHTGFVDTVHGGLIASVLDEIMAWTCGIVGGRFSYSIDLNIRFSHPLRPNETTRGIGTIEKNLRRRIFHARAKLLVADTEIATATGKYLAIKSAQEAILRADFGEDAALLDPYLKPAPSSS